MINAKEYLEALYYIKSLIKIDLEDENTELGRRALTYVEEAIETWKIPFTEVKHP